MIARARRNRKRIGGGLRQAGFLAAAGLIAMNEMSLRLDEDHANAKALAQKLEALEGVEVAQDQLDINMIFFRLTNLADSSRFVKALKEQGILINDADHGIYRLVTHWGIEAADLPRIAAAIERCRKEM